MDKKEIPLKVVNFILDMDNAQLHSVHKCAIGNMRIIANVLEKYFNCYVSLSITVDAFTTGTTLEYRLWIESHHKHYVYDSWRKLLLGIRAIVKLVLV